MAEEKKEPLIGINVMRVDADFGVNPDDYAVEGEGPSESAWHSATVTMVMTLYPMESQNHPQLSDINRKVEAIGSGLAKMNSVAKEELDLRLKEMYPTIKIDKPE